MNRIKDFFYDFIDILLLLAILLGSAYVVYYNLDHLMDLKGTSKVVTKMVEEKKDSTIHITIPEGIDKEQLAKLLKGYHIVENETQFVNKFDQMKKTIIKSGDFQLKQSMSIEEIINTITK